MTNMFEACLSILTFCTYQLLAELLSSSHLTYSWTITKPKHTQLMFVSLMALNIPGPPNVCNGSLQLPYEQ
ncbi:hypothetical protein BX666DRAFT_1997385 [Dichotomocladium elegans]|nr:hypothetical protein BX666DRAFT_1997385 [Dichotomocladium elegans]